MSARSIAIPNRVRHCGGSVDWSVFAGLSILSQYGPREARNAQSAAPSIDTATHETIVLMPGKFDVKQRNAVVAFAKANGKYRLLIIASSESGAVEFGTAIADAFGAGGWVAVSRQKTEPISFLRDLEL